MEADKLARKLERERKKILAAKVKAEKEVAREKRKTEKAEKVTEKKLKKVGKVGKESKEKSLQFLLFIENYRNIDVICKAVIGLFFNCNDIN